MDKLRVGLIGAGAIATRGHIPAYRQAEGIEVVALCDINEERVKQVAKELGIPSVYTNYEPMLEEAELDIVSVCSPNAFHAPMAIAALKAGCHVLCEKPMALTTGDAQAMVNAAKRTGQSLTVGHHMRYQPALLDARAKIAKGELGDLYYAKASYLRRSGIPGYGSWFTNKDLAGGGALMDIGCHMLDLTLWLIGHPKPVTVSASTYSQFGPRAKGLGSWGADHYAAGARFDVDDLTTAFVRFDNGLTMTLEASWAGHGTDGQRLQLFGTEGGIELNPGLFGKEQPLHYFGDDGAQLTEEPVDFPAPDGGSYAYEVRTWIESIRKGEPALITPEQGAMVVQIIEAAYKSATSGQEVRLD